jgi:hypothetical protein
MAWLRSGEPSTLGDVADQWCRLHGVNRSALENR